MMYFFFQAEDGIRDLTVTGVQTCALPISATIRVNGDLVALETAPLKPEELKSLAEQIMTPRQVKEFAEHKEADFAIGVPGVGRFRTNVYQQRGTVAFAFRAIPYEVKTIR